MIKANAPVKEEDKITKLLNKEIGSLHKDLLSLNSKIETALNKSSSKKPQSENAIINLDKLDPMTAHGRSPVFSIPVTPHLSYRTQKTPLEAAQEVSRALLQKDLQKALNTYDIKSSTSLEENLNKDFARSVGYTRNPTSKTYNYPFSQSINNHEYVKVRIFCTNQTHCKFACVGCSKLFLLSTYWAKSN